jgi:hypothetical protein
MLSLFDMRLGKRGTSLTAGCATCLSIKSWNWDWLSDIEAAEGEYNHDGREKVVVEMHSCCWSGVLR